nr:hypothetical protein [Dongshaea marina]
MEFKEVLAEHFLTFSRDPLPHTQIEQALLQIGGGGNEGMKFKKDIIAAGGWSHTGVVSFGKYPDEACKAFNNVRAALEKTEDPKELMKILTEG